MKSKKTIGGAGSTSPASAGSPRCEGFRRYGGAFSLGPVTWEQCRETATVMLTIREKKHRGTFPACQTCWNEALSTAGIVVTDAKPITANARHHAEARSADSVQADVRP